MSPMDSFLGVQDLTVHFGGVTALNHVNLNVLSGTCQGVIGPNGAGKTTLFNCISRLIQPEEGSITFCGQELLNVPPYVIPRLGIARTFQNLALVNGLSVAENIMVGSHVQHAGGLLDEAVLIWRKRREERRVREQAEEALRLVGLFDLRERPVVGLPYGTLKLIELARALVIKPKLLMMDEPTSGLNLREIEQLQKRLRSLRDTIGLTMLIISHHVEFLLSIADTVSVLSFGNKIAEGKPQEVKGNPTVIAAYLGSEED